MPIYNIIANAGSGKYLNIGDTYTAQNGTNVNVYTGTGSNDQRWYLDSLSTTKELLVYLNGNRKFALNAKRSGTNWNCTLYQSTTETEKTDEYIRLERVGTTGSIYYIKLARYDGRYLTIDSEGNVYWKEGLSGGTNQQWKFSVIPTPTVVSGDYITAGKDGWLRLYKKPTCSRTGTTVSIPLTLPTVTYKGITYSFKNKKYWYAYEGHLNGSATSMVGTTPVINKDGKGYTDEYGNYWMAVGPKVINPSLSDSATPTPTEMYGRGKLDIVVKSSDGTLYYIPAVVGDTKNHTWNNGIVQTYRAYPNGTWDPATTNFDGLVCAEFIGSFVNGDMSGLGSYSIEKIIYYKY